MGFTEWIVQILSTDEEGEIESIRKGKPPVKFSAENMKYILKSLRLVRFNSVMGRSFALEILREVVELLIWDDRRAGGNGTQQKQGSLFDIFLEANTTEYFLYLFRLLLKATGTKSDHLSQGHIAELLQVLIILFENISCETSLFYLLSNDYINQIVLFGAPPSSNYDKWEDLPLQEEALAYYVTLIKTLSLKLNISTLPFFFNEVHFENYV
jgi:protein CLEC16A